MTYAIGESVRRFEGDDKVTGKAIYTGDLQIPGLICGKVLRSPVAHARIHGIDVSKAKSIPGVLAILTKENCTLVFHTSAQSSKINL